MEANTIFNTVKADELFVIVNLQGNLFGIPANIVDTMTIHPSVAAIPDAPPYSRGIINLRGKVFPLIDLRKRLGMRSLADETKDFCDMLLQREKEHENWMHELEGCIRENREFKLARDPHKCAFGLWYASYKPSSIIVSGILKKFAAPHAKIHGLAQQLLDMTGQGKSKEALEIVRENHNGVLAEMLRLFKELRQTYVTEQKEIIVVLNEKPKSFAIAVDSIESVELLEENSLTVTQDLNLNVLEKDLLLAIGQQRKTKRLVAILNTGVFLK